MASGSWKKKDRPPPSPPAAQPEPEKVSDWASTFSLPRPKRDTCWARSSSRASPGVGSIHPLSPSAETSSSKRSRVSTPSFGELPPAGLGSPFQQAPSLPPAHSLSASALALSGNSGHQSPAKAIILHLQTVAQWLQQPDTADYLYSDLPAASRIGDEIQRINHRIEGIARSDPDNTPGIEEDPRTPQARSGLVAPVPATPGPLAPAIISSLLETPPPLL